MKITYLGHSSFSIKAKTNTSEEITLVTDPFSKESVGINYKPQKADIVTISHDHADHNYTKNITGTAFTDYYLLDTPGEYEIKGLRVFGIKSYHDDKEGTERGQNIIFVYDFPEARICHLGDLGHPLNSNQLELLEDIDILLVPVGGKYTVDTKLAMQIIESIEPKIAIPMHYKTNNHNESYKDLATLEDFLKEAGINTPLEKELTVKSQSDLGSDLKILPLEIIS
ncbi:MBL fold metallo-hydrolase [candidate division WWE3 bacterium CG_4_9_14_3_um_filter_34_6]|uniref:MBL fold metallo-hydrolase n=1 Tax=candidate division WWE3 bacterium CG_4_9_14_3_um_filter_34_6 TaxID=1975079 RepID=A0A2M7X2C3_UNCKA|nr:MAG: MBL fold metallo-hydrolase [candidate division WWE3 bacterium CG_4_9_14_3_um_filter_34_6]